MTTRWTRLLLLPLLFAACTEDPDSGGEERANTPIEVAIGSGAKPDIHALPASRTSLDEDGETVRWQTGDRLTLWARNSASETTIDGAEFSLYHYNATYNSASFRGSIQPMPEDTYTYYAVSPVPAEHTELQAGYDIPAVQDGAFHGEWDVMVATPIEGAGPLREHDKQDANGISDNTDIVNLQFAHKIHVLKITIPRNDLGEPISEIVLTFPSPVAGRLTVDASDPAADGVLTESGNTLTLHFAEPKDAGAVVYAMIAPVTLGEDETVSIVAAGATSESEPRTFAPATADRSFAAGHTTPINYNVPAAAQELTRVTFRLTETGVNTLGEAINTFTVTAPTGWTFEDGTQSRTFDVTGTGDHTIRFRGYTNPTEEMGGFQVTYDSEHALLTEAFTLPAVTAGEETVVELRVPYLYDEDFTTSIANDFDINSAWKSTNFNDTSATTLSALPDGWTGACVGGKTGVGIRVASHCIHGLFTVYTRCPGRADSAPILGIKEGKYPNVRVSYTYGGDRFEGVGSGGNILVSAGYTLGNNNPINSDQTIANIKVPEASIAIDGGQDDNADYTLGSRHEVSYRIDQCSRGVRLSWRVYNDRSSTGNGTYWLYLDNIKVQIVQ